MLRVISVNVNGIRAAGRKGFFDWLAEQEADFVCLQETKAQMAHLPDELYRPEGYHCYFHDAEKKGYSGVGIYCRQEPVKVTRGFGHPVADNEGRYIQVDYPGLSVVSIYLPSGSSGDERQAVKYEFMAAYEKLLALQKQSGRPFIICGDWNIVHKEIDIKNWKSNQKNSGCLPQERAWLDTLLTSGGFVDAFRVVNSNAGEYTWWSNRGRARENNVGWRIDYQMITTELTEQVRAARVYKDSWFSDHAPLTIDYDLAADAWQK